jgi:flagellar motor switch protein FliN/FliY
MKLMSETTDQEQIEAQAKPDPVLAQAAEEAAIGKAKSNSAETSKERNVDALLNVKLNVRVVLGHKRLPVSDLLQLTRGSVVELDRKVGDPVDIMVNDRIIARGDLVKLEGNLVGVALREIVKDFVPAD